MDRNDSRIQNKTGGEQTGREKNGATDKFSDKEKKQELWTDMITEIKKHGVWENGERKHTGRQTSSRTERRNKNYGQA